MMWIFGIVVVLLMGGVAVVAAGRGEPLAPSYDDRPDVLLPTARPLGAEELRRVRFTVGLRGYRASEVDALLARLADELEARGPSEPRGPLEPSAPERPDEAEDAAPPPVDD